MTLLPQVEKCPINLVRRGTHWNLFSDVYLLPKLDVSCSFSVTGDIDFQTDHFADFEQFKADIHLANFEQVKIDPICSLILFRQVKSSLDMQRKRIQKIQEPGIGSGSSHFQ